MAPSIELGFMLNRKFHHLGLSANLMSLGGLAIAIGLMVDGSVVVVENAFAKLGRDAGESRVRTILEAARHFDWSLPEVFAGFDRTETPFPIAYPTAARPQAWAAGAPVLCLQLLLGLRPDRRQTRLVSDAPPDVPRWAGTLRLQGVRAFNRIWDVRLEGGAVAVADIEVEA